MDRSSGKVRRLTLRLNFEETSVRHGRLWPFQRTFAHASLCSIVVPKNRGRRE